MALSPESLIRTIDETVAQLGVLKGRAETFREEQRDSCWAKVGSLKQDVAYWRGLALSRVREVEARAQAMENRAKKLEVENATLMNKLTIRNDQLHVARQQAERMEEVVGRVQQLVSSKKRVTRPVLQAILDTAGSGPEPGAITFEMMQVP